MASTAAQKFDNRTAQVVFMAFGGLVVLIGLSGVTVESYIEGGVYVAVGAYTIYRSRRSFQVVLAGDAVTVRSMVRTQRFALTELHRAEVARGPIGVVGYLKEYLVFHLADGEEFAPKEFNGKPSDEPTVAAAEAINAAIRHGHP